MKVIAVHSFRGGTGKSNLTANVAATLAAKGKRVGTVDLDLKAPGLHVIYDVPSHAMKWKLNDFLWDRCSSADMVIDLTEHLGLSKGSLYFIPASFNLDDLIKIVEQGYEVTRFNSALNAVSKEFNLDYLILDTHPGIDEEIVLAVATADIIVEVMRIDQQDLTGAYVSLAVAAKLGKKPMILVNMVPKSLGTVGMDLVQKTFDYPILGELPFYEDVMAARSKGVFVLKHANHPLAQQISKIADQILAM